ncbi:Abi family protein [Gulosibacter sp. 10]|uniref:Abi family protein n=1 Tax=Gulosibacter sp. 10 TaxID=1255570 RepID=UPI001595D7A9|nr:Abi family protein [Gulosibacter sp. 10]
MPSTYTKPLLALEEQLARLVERGMEIRDEESALRKLQAIGYYRLSGYWYPFREEPSDLARPRPSTFAHGTTLDEVIEIYCFDEHLRAALLGAIARIEVALRFWVGHRLGRRGPFAHTDAAQLDPNWSAPRSRICNRPDKLNACSWQDSEHDEWLAKQRQIEDISNEAFVAHIHNSYGKPLPVWTATETMTFESLNRLYGNLLPQDREQIAVELDVLREDGNGDVATFANWIEHLRQSRNLCAHHARLWNRNHTAPLAVPYSSPELQHLLSSNVHGDGAREVSLAARRVYGTITLVAYLLARIDYSNQMRDELLNLVLAFAGNRPERLASMGFPEDWRDQEIWSRDYGTSPERRAQAKLLRQVEVLYAKDAAERLWKKDAEGNRRSLLNYYRKRGALLSVPGTSAHRYPSFQFDTSTGDVYDLVITANRRLLDGQRGSEETRWRALAWWLTPLRALGSSTSPLDALTGNALTQRILDDLLAPRADEQPISRT